jgi:hypothetical protein
MKHFFLLILFTALGVCQSYTTTLATKCSILEDQSAGNHFFTSFAISANWARAAWRSSTISAAMMSGSGRLALSLRLSSSVSRCRD